LGDFQVPFQIFLAHSTLVLQVLQFCLCLQNTWEMSSSLSQHCKQSKGGNLERYTTSLFVLLQFLRQLSPFLSPSAGYVVSYFLNGIFPEIYEALKLHLVPLRISKKRPKLLLALLLTWQKPEVFEAILGAFISSLQEITKQYP